MSPRPTKTQRAYKPTLDAVNDTVAALTELVRSLRASAKAGATRAKASAGELKLQGKVASEGVGAKARKVGRRITTGLGRAWNALTDGQPTPQPKRRVAGRKRTPVPRP